MEITLEQWTLERKADGSLAVFKMFDKRTSATAWIREMCAGKIYRPVKVVIVRLPTAAGKKG